MSDRDGRVSEDERADEGAEDERVGGRADRRSLLRAALAFTIIGTFGGLTPTAHADDPDCATGTPTAVGDRDASCNDGGGIFGGIGGEPDEGCAISSPASGASGKDEDQNCQPSGGLGYDPDDSCGDCDDNHDTDDTCGNSHGGPGGGSERDELCGHQHFGPLGNEDANCNKDQGGGVTSIDEGCGRHNTSYGGYWTDTDQHCNPAEIPGTSATADQNCASQQADAWCGVNRPAYSTSPDEVCGLVNQGGGLVDRDSACGQSGSIGGSKAYDMDESCKTYTPDPVDEACGAKAFGAYDADENCGRLVPATGLTDVDEACGLTGVLQPEDQDNNCGGGLGGGLTDPDDDCFARQETDDSCGYGPPPGEPDEY